MSRQEFDITIPAEMIAQYPQRFSMFDDLSENGKSLLLYLYSGGQSSSNSIADKGKVLMSNEQAYELFAKANETPHFLEDYIVSYDQQMDTTGAITSLAEALGVYLPIESGLDIPVEFYTKIQEMVLLEPYLQELNLTQEQLASMSSNQVAARLGINEKEMYVEHFHDRQFYVPQVLYQDLL